MQLSCGPGFPGGEPYSLRTKWQIIQAIAYLWISDTHVAVNIIPLDWVLNMSHIY